MKKLFLLVGLCVSIQAMDMKKAVTKVIVVTITKKQAQEMSVEERNRNAAKGMVHDKHGNRIIFRYELSN